jgi:exoribonuclease R
LRKKLDEWGGESAITQSFSKIKTLVMESESKDAKIQELNDKLGVISENKGTELLQALSSVNDEGDKKSKAALIQEISQKSNEILELKEKLAQAMHNLRNSKSNPFEKAGGSDDEDNKERVQQRTSIEGMVSKD